MSQIVVLGFVTIILVGSALLCLPFATKAEGTLSYIDALFTSASATCVTGLVIAETYTTFTVFGQIVILLLIQVGGLGFMTLSSAIYLMIGKRIALRTQLDMQNDFDSDGGSRGFKKIIIQIVTIAFVFEALGAIVLTGAFCKYYDFGTALGKGVFAAISAFCNAGFDLTPSGEYSLLPYNDNPFVLITIMVLIIVGGIGFLVVKDIFEKKRWQRFKLHTRVVVVMTLALIFAGAIFIGIFEWNNSFSNMSFGQKILNAFFSSVTTRTAGFDSVGMYDFEQSSQIVAMLLMFVGASPSSTGGGIKTTTFFVLLWAVICTVRKKEELVISKREISDSVLKRAISTIVIAINLIAVSVLLISLFEDGAFSLQQILFEEISAFATVGLSLGITGGLSVGSKLVIILSMFIGRVGMLTFFMSLSPQGALSSKIKFKQAQISI